MQREYDRWSTGRSRHGRDHGFTLVELLVVIGIIAILVSLTLPAVQSAREAARRIQCSNNIRQLGLAVLQYEAANRRLPPGGIVESNDKPDYSFGTFDPRSGKMFSWVVLVLPYIEQTTLYEQFDRRLTVLQQPKDPQQTYLSALACPSDSASENFFEEETLTEGKRFAKGNYAAYVSPYHIDLQYVLPGALGGNGQPLRKVSDGVTNTILLAEVLTRSDEHDQRGVWALPWAGASILAYDSHYIDSYGVMEDTMNNHESRRIPFVIDPCYLTNPLCLESMQTPNKQTGNQDVLYSCKDVRQNQLEGMPCGEWTKKKSSMHYLSAAPRSNHKTGVNIVHLDGHTDYLANEVDPVVMAYQISVADGANQPKPPTTSANPN